MNHFARGWLLEGGKKPATCSGGRVLLEYLHCAGILLLCIDLWNPPGSERLRKLLKKKKKKKVKKVAQCQTANKWQSQGSSAVWFQSLLSCTARLYIYRCYQPALGVLGHKHFATFKDNLGEVRSWFSNLPCTPTTLHSPLHTGLPFTGEHPCRAVPFWAVSHLCIFLVPSPGLSTVPTNRRLSVYASRRGPAVFPKILKSSSNSDELKHC